MIEAKHKLSIKESLELIESLILVADEQMIDKIKKAIKNREDELIDNYFNNESRKLRKWQGRTW